MEPNTLVVPVPVPVAKSKKAGKAPGQAGGGQRAAAAAGVHEVRVGLWHARQGPPQARFYVSECMTNPRTRTNLSRTTTMPSRCAVGLCGSCFYALDVRVL